MFNNEKVLMKMLISTMLLLVSLSSLASTTCMTLPNGNLQCNGFDSNGNTISTTTTELPNENYQTQGYSGDQSIQQTCYTEPNGNFVCN